LRFQEGFLKRCSESEAMLSLFRLMGNTPHGSWTGCPHFGLREFLEDAKMRPEQAQRAVEEMNRALESLGITHVRVESIGKPEQLDREKGSLAINLVFTDDPAKTSSLRVER